MATLATNTIASTYTMLLKMKDTGIDGTLNKIESGDADDGALALSTTAIGIDKTDNLHFDGIDGDFSASNTYMQEGADDRLDFVVGGDANGFILLESGGITNVGIGTLTPGENLEVAGANAIIEINATGTTDAELVLSDAGTKRWSIYNDASSADELFIADDDATRRLTILQDGNVGLGTDSPQCALNISKAPDTVDGVTCNLLITSPSSAASTGIQMTSTSGKVAFMQTNGKLLIYTDGEATGNGFAATDCAIVVLENGGYVGVGESSAFTPLQKLHVSEDRSANYAARFHNDGDDADRYGIMIDAGDYDGTTGTTYFVRCNDGNGGPVGYIQHASGVFTATGASDVRLKKDIVDTAVKGLDTVNAMKVRDYKWKANDGDVTAGFIANELKEVFPSAVFGEEDAMESYEAEYDDDGNIKKEAGERITPMTLSRDLLVPVLVKAIQELSAKVTALENA